VVARKGAEDGRSLILGASNVLNARVEDEVPGRSDDANDRSRLEQVDHTDGTNVKSTVVRHYDDADRLEWIKHFSLAADPNNPSLLLWIKYVWNTDNTVATRTEIDYTVSPAMTAVVTFGYDGRKRLISETRVVDPNVVVCALAYTYDQLGNRKTKQDYMPAGRLTEYVYDTDPNVWADPNHFGLDPQYQTRNNRLLLYREYDPNAAGGSRLVRTVRYTYYVTGHVSNITIKDEDPNGGGSPTDPNNPYNWYRDLALYYTINDELYRAVWDTWRVWPPTGELIDYTALTARDFVCDSPRELVAVQDLVWGTDYFTGTGWVPASPERRTDYVGEQPYQDYTTWATWDDPNSLWTVETAETRRHLGPAEQPLDPNDPNAPLGTQWRHGDLIASTMLETDEAGEPIYPGTATSAVLGYTAFGEPVFDPNTVATRYQYAGGWGYHTGLAANDPNVPPNDLLGLRGVNPSLPAITLLHVGARWYDPAIGRFIQRDPIGLRGGLNTYGYCRSDPVVRFDPKGLQSVAPIPTVPGYPEPPVMWRPPVYAPDTPWTGPDNMPRNSREAAHICFANYGLAQCPGEWEYSDEPPPWMRRPCHVCGQPDCPGHIGGTAAPKPVGPLRPWEMDPGIPVY
jgi:hypothetical protein